MDIDIEYFVNSAFKAIIGREAEEESLSYWCTHISSGGCTLYDFLMFLRRSAEGVNNIDQTSYEYILRYIYAVSGYGSCSGDPYTINSSSYHLIFMHIPKAAGISIVNSIAKGFHPLQIGSYTFGKNVELQTGIHKFHVGHFSVNEIDLNNRNAILSTSLREPKSRIVSLYDFLKKVDPNDPIWGAAAKAANEYALGDFLAIEAYDVKFAFDNYYTRVFSGSGVPFYDISKKLTKSDLTMAANNITKFDHVIRMEDIGDGINSSTKLSDDLLCRMNIAIRNIGVINKGSAKTQPSVESVPDSLVYFDYELLKQYY